MNRKILNLGRAIGIFFILSSVISPSALAERKILDKGMNISKEVLEANQVEYDAEKGIARLYWEYEGQSGVYIHTPNTLINLIVQADVPYDPKTGLFHYRYLLKGLPGSQQNLLQFGFGHQAIILNTKAPERGWTRGKSFLPGNFEAIGFHYPAWRFTDFDEERALQPVREYRFEVVSPAPPVLVPCFAQGRVPFTISHVEGPTILRPRVRAVFPSSLIKGKTIGPGSVQLSSYERLQALQDSLDELHEEGWIQDSAIIQPLKEHLDDIQQALHGRDSLDRRTNSLVKQCLKFLDRNRSENLLLTEAVSVIKGNLLFMVDALQKKEPDLKPSPTLSEVETAEILRGLTDQVYRLQGVNRYTELRRLAVRLLVAIKKEERDDIQIEATLRDYIESAEKTKKKGAISEEDHELLMEWIQPLLEKKENKKETRHPRRRVIKSSR